MKIETYLSDWAYHFLHRHNHNSKEKYDHIM